MATQRIASASVRGALVSNSGSSAQASLQSSAALSTSSSSLAKQPRILVKPWVAAAPVINNETNGRRWKSAPAVALDKLDSENIGSVSKELAVGERKTDELDLTFLNHKAAFKNKTTWEVFRAYAVFNLCSIRYLVDNNEMLMKLGKAVLGKALFAKVMKMSFYGQFVAGENRQAIKPAIHRMHSFGVKSILDYSVEEDISEQEAEQREMNACKREATPENFDVKQLAHKGDYKADIKRYHAHEEFGDRRKGNTGARTYFYQNEAQCEKNMETFLRCIEAVADSTRSTGFSAIKLTALGRPNLLMQLSEVITRAKRYYQEATGQKGFIHEGRVDKDAFEKRFKEKDIYHGNDDVQKWLSNMTFDKKGLLHLFSWSGLLDSDMLLKEAFQVPNLKTGKMEPLITALTEKEEEQFRNMLTRLHTIFQAAKDLDVRVMVDAEQSYFQPAISRLALEMMKKYNTDKAIVFNTYQCYLKNALRTLTLDLEQAHRQDFYFGAKLVRGAYMEQERARADNLGYVDPINPDFEATSAMYHACLNECMRRMHELKQFGDGREKKVGIMVASHNADTLRYTIERMKELEIRPEDRLICFGQLYGMCDNLTFPLGQAGYSVYKYVPYGPVNEVLPYLSRRARENGGMLTKLAVEKRLLRKELTSRLLTGKIFTGVPKGDYVPVGFDKTTMRA